MAYRQGGNPLSRKSSPLNAKNPFNRVSPLNMKNADGVKHRDMSDEQKAKHKAEKHSTKKDPAQVDAQREEDNTQAANQPMGPERRSSRSPLNAHEEGHPGLGSEPNMDPCSPEFDHEIASDAGYSADDFKQYKEANCPEGGEEAPAEEATTEEVPQ